MKNQLNTNCFEIEKQLKLPGPPKLPLGLMDSLGSKNLKGYGIHYDGQSWMVDEDIPCSDEGEREIHLVNPKNQDGSRKVILIDSKTQSVSIDDFDEEEKAYLNELSIQVNTLVADGFDNQAYELTTSLTNDEKLALWTLLDSKARSALKKQSTLHLAKAA